MADTGIKEIVRVRVPAEHPLSPGRGHLGVHDVNPSAPICLAGTEGKVHDVGDAPLHHVKPPESKALTDHIVTSCAVEGRIKALGRAPLSMPSPAGGGLPAAWGSDAPDLIVDIAGRVSSEFDGRTTATLAVPSMSGAIGLYNTLPGLPAKLKEAYQKGDAAAIFESILGLTANSAHVLGTGASLVRRGFSLYSLIHEPKIDPAAPPSGAQQAMQVLGQVLNTVFGIYYLCLLVTSIIDAVRAAIFRYKMSGSEQEAFALLKKELNVSNEEKVSLEVKDEPALLKEIQTLLQNRFSDLTKEQAMIGSANILKGDRDAAHAGLKKIIQDIKVTRLQETKKAKLQRVIGEKNMELLEKAQKSPDVTTEMIRGVRTELNKTIALQVVSALLFAIGFVVCVLSLALLGAGDALKGALTSAIGALALILNVGTPILDGVQIVPAIQAARPTEADKRRMIIHAIVVITLMAVGIALYVAFSLSTFGALPLVSLCAGLLIYLAIFSVSYKRMSNNVRKYEEAHPTVLSWEAFWNQLGQQPLKCDALFAKLSERDQEKLSDYLRKHEATLPQIVARIRAQHKAFRKLFTQ